MNNLNDKMMLSTPDGAERNTALLTEWVAQTFPNCITEGKVDFDLLRQECSNEIVDGGKERYRLEWSGKRNAIVTANLASVKTLRPIREDSKDFDTTENLYIEGDNLEVLKLLQESYLGKVKMIYIDPPYNTGNEFVYNDDFSKDERESLIEQGIIDDDGTILTSNKNSKDNPRYHSDWLSFMFPRLKLARNLLSEDGVIFISIDDNEVHNLRKICDDGMLFGERNFVAQFVWKKKQGGGNDSSFVVVEHEYILCYAKNISNVKFNLDKKYKLDDALYPNRDEKGEYGLITLDKASIQFSQSLVYEIVGPDGMSYFPRVVKGKQSCWRWSKKKVEEQYDDLVFKDGKVYTKYYRPEGVTPKSLLIDSVYGRTESGNDDISALFEKNPFSYPKPVSLINHFISIGSDKDSIILDFFSGSATTAHAVMQLNAEDGGNRKFIMVQLPEKTDEKSEAYKAGYKNICEIGKERIRRAGKKIMEEHPDAKIDTGFKVFRLDVSNIKNVMRKPGELTQGELNFKEFNNVVDNLVDGRTPDDLLYQVMIAWGLPLDLPVERTEMCGKTVYKVDGNSLFCCFEDGVDSKLATAMAKEKPMRVLFSDSAFKDDTEKENVKQTLVQINPETEMKVL